jgi:hypothetical protein
MKPFVIEVVAQLRVHADESIRAEADELLYAAIALSPDAHVAAIALLNVSPHVSHKGRQPERDVLDLPQIPNTKAFSAITMALTPSLSYSIDDASVAAASPVGLIEPYVRWRSSPFGHRLQFTIAHEYGSTTVELDDESAAERSTASVRRWIRADGSVCGVRLSTLIGARDAPIDHYRQMLTHELGTAVMDLRSRA